MTEIKKRNILFICHEGSRTGAPLLLLRLIREVVNLDIYSVKILLMHGGPLEDEMSQVAETHLLDYPGRGKYSLKERIYLKLNLNRLTRQARYDEMISRLFAEADIIFANTIISVNAVERFDITGKRLFFFLHELEFAVKALVTEQQLAFIRNRAELIFVPADFVKKFYIRKLSFPPEKIRLLKYIIPNYANVQQWGKRQDRTFTVGCCGSLEGRKGADIFLQLAYYIVYKLKYHYISFVWVGANKKSLEYFLFEEDLRKSGLENHFSVFPSIPDPIEEVSKFDIFALTSREDPYPVAVLEAAGVAVPTIYFRDAGGIGEFLKDGGIDVDYLDVQQMGDQIIRLAGNRDLLGKLSAHVYKSYTSEPKATEILDVFRQALN